MIVISEETIEAYLDLVEADKMSPDLLNEEMMEENKGLVDLMFRLTAQTNMPGIMFGCIVTYDLIKRQLDADSIRSSNDG